MNGGYTDGGEVLTRTLRDIPDFVHSADADDDDISVQLSTVHAGAYMHSIDGKGCACQIVEITHLACFLTEGSEASDHTNTSSPA